MILKEKFNKLIPIEFGGMQEPLLSNCVEIAEDFAKKVLRVYIKNKTLQYKQSQGDYSLDELLIIIKKEL